MTVPFDRFVAEKCCEALTFTRRGFWGSEASAYAPLLWLNYTACLSGAGLALTSRNDTETTFANALVLRGSRLRTPSPRGFLSPNEG